MAAVRNRQAQPLFKSSTRHTYLVKELRTHGLQSGSLFQFGTRPVSKKGYGGIAEGRVTYERRRYVCELEKIRLTKRMLRDA
jgi:hypothetical protein